LVNTANVWSIIDTTQDPGSWPIIDTTQDPSWTRIAA